MNAIQIVPAILLAGPPHCGKSVLAYQLTLKLRAEKIAHYLLRAVPDGEGNWFLNGKPEVARELRSKFKRGYSDRFVEHMHSVISARMVPLLVDIGGLPRGNQWSIPAACTHSILLYHTEEQLAEWRAKLSEMNLIPLAELCSIQNREDEIWQTDPLICGIISGLEREESLRKIGIAFNRLVNRVVDVLKMDEVHLENHHRENAPQEILSEKVLAEQIGIYTANQPLEWQPSQLQRVIQNVPHGQSTAIYGRGPVWLAATLAVHSLPEKAWIFDVRYGWLKIPRIRTWKQSKLNIVQSENAKFDWLEVTIPDEVYEKTKQIDIPPLIKNKSGVVISGKLSRWIFSALACYFSHHYDWVAVRDSGKNYLVVVASRSTDYKIGDALPIEKSGPINAISG